MATDTTVIIVTFRSKSIIEECLDSFSGYPVIIVDNNSGDGIEELIRSKYPKVTFIQTGKNLGYGRANNIGLRACITKYGLIINPDIFIKAKQIKELEKIANKHKNAAMVSPYFVNPEWDLSNHTTDLGDSSIGEVQQDIYSVAWVTGCAILCDIAKLKKVGLFDENIFMFCEEHDLCNRVREQNYKILQSTNILVPHAPGMSSAPSTKITYLRSWHWAWSRLYLRQKNKGTFKTIYSYPKFYGSYLKGFLKAVFTLNRLAIIENLAKMSGTLNHMLGFKAFDENDNPRGLF